jgi:hypothetical protein
MNRLRVRAKQIDKALEGQITQSAQSCRASEARIIKKGEKIWGGESSGELEQARADRHGENKLKFGGGVPPPVDKRKKKAK